jgi:O-antigen/teichoic acid export membrane protein
VSSIAIARSLGRTGFGELAAVQSTIGLFGVLAGVSLGLTASRYVGMLRSRDPERAGRVILLTELISLIFAALFSSVLFLLAPALAARTLNAPHLAHALRVACALLTVNSLTAAQSGSLAGLEAFRTIAGVNFVRGTLTLPLVIVGTKLGGLPGTLWGLSIAGATCWILAWFGLAARCRVMEVPLRLEIRRSDLEILWEFSLPALISGSLAAPATWLTNAILLNQPGGYAQMGMFNAANQWRIAIAFLPGVLWQTFFPILSNMGGDPTAQQSYRRMIDLVAVLMLALAAAVALPLSLMAGWILPLYGPGFIEGRPIFTVVAGASVVMAVDSAAGCALGSAGKMWALTGFTVGWGVLLVFCSVILIPRHLALGLALSWFLAYALEGTLRALYVFRANRCSIEPASVEA